MKRTLLICALTALMLTTASCSFKIFEDIGSSPHPPSVNVTSLAIFVPPPPSTTPESTTPPSTTPAASVAQTADSSPQDRAITWDSGGFTIITGQLIQIGIAYTDAGGDIVKFSLRDLDGGKISPMVPADQTYFSGTSGTFVGPKLGLGLAGIVGPHRFELWAEDSHGTRSEKVEFIINFAL